MQNKTFKKACFWAVIACVSSNVAWAAPKSCEQQHLGAGADKVVCVYEGQGLNQVYQHVRSVLDGGMLLREQFPQQAVSEELPENNEEGLVKVDYAVKNGMWYMDLGYQGSEATVLLRPKGRNVEVEVVMSAD